MRGLLLCSSVALTLSAVLCAGGAEACRSIEPGGCDAWSRSGVIWIASYVTAPMAIPPLILGSVVAGFAAGSGPISRPLVLTTMALSSISTAANAGVLLAAAINGEPPGVLFYNGPALAVSAAALGVSAWAFRFRMAPVIVAPTLAGDRVMFTLAARF